MNDPRRARQQRQARTLRLFRKVHRTTGAFLFALFFVLACTGLLLGWKKHTGGLILPKSHAGTSTVMREWLPVGELHERAMAVARDSISPGLSLELERIDIRPDLGMVKFVFVEGYWGIQLDCATGELLHIERRRSDFIENIHDGSILDHLAGIRGERFKVAYTSVMGVALLTFTITGFWLWIGPKRMRAMSGSGDRRPRGGA